MPVPILCHVCHQSRYQVRGPDSYACRTCGSRTTSAEFPVGVDERLIVLEGILQVLAVPDGHQVITPNRRCYAPHLGARLALALRLDRARARAVFAHAEDVEAAEGLLAALDADERGPWVLSPAQLDVLTRAMDVSNALLPSTSRQYPEFDAEIRNAHAMSRRPRRLSAAMPRASRPRTAPTARRDRPCPSRRPCTPSTAW
ncbi:hypothetical protein ACFYPC_35600 [Streptomyces sp. NPDC005808]|uniref:hypothetical protein n=1 Tax=Streptomyces sp. NPDC005808 TaxID=3364734 RepID=UPI0036A760C7